MRFDNLIIFTDLDGTLFCDDKSICKRNLDAIEYFKSNGGKFSIATGRSTFSVEKQFPSLIKLVNFYAIVSNGGHIFDFNRGIAENYFYIDNCIFNNIVRKIYDAFGNIPCEIYEKDRIILNNPDNFIYRHMDGMSEHCTVINDFNYHFNDEFRFLFGTSSEKELADVEKYFNENFGEELYVFKSERLLIELLKKGASKGAQVKYLKNKYSEKKFICFGDYQNDSDMLKSADVAVCPSNALDSIKEICKYELCSNNDGVIAEFIDKYENGQITI